MKNIYNNYHLIHNEWHMWHLKIIDWVDVVKSFLKYYKPYKGLFFYDFGSASCWIIRVNLSTHNEYIDRLLPTNNWNLIVIFGLLLLGVFAIESVLKFVVTYWGHKLGTNIERDMRNDLYGHIQN